MKSLEKNSAEKEARWTALLEEGRSLEWVNAKKEVEKALNNERNENRAHYNSMGRVQLARQTLTDLQSKKASPKALADAKNSITYCQNKVLAAGRRYSGAKQRLHMSKARLAAIERKEAKYLRKQQQRQSQQGILLAHQHNRSQYGQQGDATQLHQQQLPELPQEMDIDNYDSYPEGTNEQFSYAGASPKLHAPQTPNLTRKKITFHFFLSDELLGAVPVTLDQCSTSTLFFEHALSACNLSNSDLQSNELTAARVNIYGSERPMVLPWRNHNAYEAMLETLSKASMDRDQDLDVDVTCLRM